MLDEAYRKILSEIADLLEKGQDYKFAVMVRNFVEGPEEACEKFLVSDGLWGGSGSLADSAFAYGPALVDLMAELGRFQIATGYVNPRTAMWVKAFENWRQGLSWAVNKNS